MLTIAGGVYFEHCTVPAVRELYGSAGRAAAALSRLCPIALHTFFPTTDRDDVIFNMAAVGIHDVHVHPSSDVVEFHYSHPMASPRIAPIPLPVAEPVNVSGEAILRFGALEGEFVTSASRAVYDPQSGGRPKPYSSNGSSAETLAMVLNEKELFTLSPAVDHESAIKGLSDTPKVVVVKCGPQGALVFEDGALLGTAHAYQTHSVYKIGSGDIFSATFSYLWMIKNLSPIDAAIGASRYAAHYVETREAQMPDLMEKRDPWVPKELRPKKVYLAGSFFCTQAIWLIEEARSGLKSLGIPHFSPLHDVGFSTTDEVAAADLAGLDECPIVLAMLSDMDPGTLFEIGYAQSKGKDIIALIENPGPQDLTMITGSGCRVFNDLSSALYHASWLSFS